MGQIKHTWHPIEESPAAAIVRLQELAVCRPVHVCDEAVGADALSNFLVPLHNTINVHGVVIGADSQMGPIGGILELMDSLLPVLDVDHFGHISGDEKKRLFNKARMAKT